MKVVLISDKGDRHQKITINIWLHILLPILLLAVGLSFVVYYLSLSKTLPSDKDKITHKKFSQVLNKLSVLDTEVHRLNSLGEFIASQKNLDIDNFDLFNVSVQGGVLKNNYFGSSIVRGNNIYKSVSKVERNLEKQRLKLKNLVVSLEIKEAEEYLKKLSNTTQLIVKTHKYMSKKIPYDFSTPLKKGYISSPFGERRDPINGSLRHHGGLDIAANKGNNVYAIANGFVSFSGDKGAYGNLLEINHSALLKSRYAHLDQFLVQKGQLVKKGDLIGKVGATGRVTGPHLHLEIRENNKIRDPKLYLNDALKNL